MEAVRLLFAVVSLLGTGSEAFLHRGSYLPFYGDIFGIYCQNKTNAPIFHHEQITKEAVRRVMRDYYMENLTASGRKYIPSERASLEKMFTEFYDGSASPQWHIKSVDEIIGNPVSGLPRYHFDDGLIGTSENILARRWKHILKAEDVTVRRMLVSISLASLQDFYSHTNWIELGNNNIKRDLGIQGGTMKDSLKSCKSTASLSSDFVSSNIKLSDRCYGKDTPSPCFSPRADLHLKAATLATQASYSFLSSLRSSIDVSSFLSLMGAYPTPPLVIVSPLSLPEGGINDIVQTLETTQRRSGPSYYPPLKYTVVLYNRDSSVKIEAESIRELKQKLLSVNTNGYYQAYRNSSSNTPPVLSAFASAAESSDPNSVHFIIYQDDVVRTEDGFLNLLVTEKRLKVVPVLLIDSIPELYRFRKSTEYSTKIKVGGKQINARLNSVRRVLDYMALSSGSETIMLSSSRITDMGTIIRQFPANMVTVYHTRVPSNSRMAVTLPLDRTIKNILFHINGNFTAASALFTNGISLDLLTNSARYSVNGKVSTPLFKLIDFDIKKFRESVGPYSPTQFVLNLQSSEGDKASVTVSALSQVGLHPAYYRMSRDKNHPSLVGITGAPWRDSRNFLDVSLFGIDEISSSESTSLENLFTGKIETSLQLQKRPRSSDYIKLTDIVLPDIDPYVIVYRGRDMNGTTILRQSNSFLPPKVATSTGTSPTIEFVSGREIWAESVSNLVIPVRITDTNTWKQYTTYTIEALLGAEKYPLMLSQKSLNLRGNTTATINVSVMVSSSKQKFNPIIQPRRSYPLKSLESFVDSNSEPSPLISEISRTRNLYKKSMSTAQITKPLIVTVKSSSGLESSMIGYVITNSGEVRKLGSHESIKQKNSKLTFSLANSFLQNNINTYKTNKIHHRLRRYIGDVTPPVIDSVITKQCTGYYLMESSCDGDYWMFSLEIRDDYALQAVYTVPAIPSLNANLNGLNYPYYTVNDIQVSCCNPSIEIIALDTYNNKGMQLISTGNLTLGAGAITGIVLGAIALLVIIIIVIVFACKKQRNSSDGIQLRTRRGRTSGDM